MSKKMRWQDVWFSKQGAGAAVILAITAALAAGYWGCGPTPQTQVVEIAARTRTAVLATQLVQAGVVRNATVFRAWVILTGRAGRLQAGEYVFPPHPWLGGVARKLARGQVRVHTLTVPEGFTAAQIAERLANEGLCLADDFLDVSNDEALAREWKVPARSLEGFLYPDTYQFTKRQSVKQIAQRMVERFYSKADPSLFTAGRRLGMNPLKLVTLASMIEREVRQPSERPVVAAVFYNRLQSRMRLESCATVLYSQGRIGGNLTLKDLETSSPYNTYRHRGLPPGPICNPGLGALQAAAHPAQSDYLFFVVRSDGRHVFSKNFEEHVRVKSALKHNREIPAMATP